MFNLVCEASGHGLGAVLVQAGRSVAFSRKLAPGEQNYHITEQQLLAVMEALKVFRCYLDGIEFNNVTDHKPNTFVDSQPTLSRRQAGWSEELITSTGSMGLVGQTLLTHIAATPHVCAAMLLQC